MSMMGHELIPLDQIRTDGGTQTRAAIDEATAQEYAEVLLAGEELPSADVFRDEAGSLWLAGGFHRHRSHVIAERPTMWCHVRQGTRRDAILFGIADNNKHGLRPSADDRKRAVSILLTDPEWSQWSDREIARMVAGCDSGAAKQLVHDTREKLSVLAVQMKEKEKEKEEREPGTRKVARGGTEYSMKTDGIGKRTRQADDTERMWLRAMLEDVERAREAGTHVAAAGQAVMALDLARGMVCDLLAGPACA